MKTIYTWCLMLLCVMAACDDRSVGSDASGVTDGVATDASPLSDAQLDECVVAVRLDSCCGLPTALGAREVAADPCVVPYEARGAKKPECSPPEECDAVDCPDFMPFSRLAERAPDGRCVFVDECASAADCVAATNIRGCCACSRAYPEALAAADPCLVQRGDDEPQCAERCDAVAEGIACEMCLEVPVLACLSAGALDGKELRVCGNAPSCSCEGGCESWQRCLISQGGGLGREGPVCGEEFGLAQCRQTCEEGPAACPPHRPYCKSLEFTAGCCSDALVMERVCCANDYASDLSNCY